MSIDYLGARLLRALLSPQDGTRAQTLLVSGSTGVVQCLTNGLPLTLLDAQHADVAEKLVAQRPEGVSHLLLVGGGKNEGAALSNLAPGWQVSRQIGLHQIDDASVYHHLKGPRLAILKDAAARAPNLEPIDEADVHSHAQTARAALEVESDFAKQRHTPWVTISIFLACAIVFALQCWWTGVETTTIGLLRMGANPGHAAFHEPWTLLSSAFLHIGVMHIAFNMIALFAFGPLMERVLGGPRYLLLYIGCAIGGSLFSAGGHEQLASAGASGALWGLMAGGAVLIWRPSGLLPPIMVARARQKIWQPLVINALYSFQPGIDWLCHLGGGVFGAALIASGLLLGGLTPDGRRRSSLLLGIGAYAAGALAVLSLGVAWAHGRPWELIAPPPLERQFVGVMGISLEVPRGLAVTRDSNTVIYGDLHRSLFVIEVDFDESATASIDEQREAMGKPIAGAEQVGTMHEENIGGRSALVVEGKFPNGLGYRCYSFVLPKGLVRLYFYQWPQTHESWKALPAQILASLQIDNQK